MKTPFSMKEYIEFHKLGVGLNESGKTRLIAQHLRKKGYIRKKGWHNGTSMWVWVRKARPKMDKEKFLKQLEGL